MNESMIVVATTTLVVADWRSTASIHTPRQKSALKKIRQIIALSGVQTPKFNFWDQFSTCEESSPCG
jgi:hypothetical protein